MIIVIIVIIIIYYAVCEGLLLSNTTYKWTVILWTRGKVTRLWWFVVRRCEMALRAGASNVRITDERRTGEVSERSWCHLRF